MLNWKPCGKTGFAAIWEGGMLHVDKSWAKNDTWVWEVKIGNLVKDGIATTPQEAIMAAEDFYRREATVAVQ